MDDDPRPAPFRDGRFRPRRHQLVSETPRPGRISVPLARGYIQAKLNTVPVFYLPDAGGIRRDLYLSYDDAVAAAFSSGGKPTDVRATTLDQVYYPLILRRGRMRMAPPPPGITAAEASLVGDAVEGAREVYRLVPSAAAVAGLSAADAKDIDVGGVDGSGVPVFSAERLAFAGPEGPQLPLFFNEQDCAETYQRLRLSPRGNGRLPEKPVIRVSSLFDQVKSMERGDKPVLNSYAFYSNNYDLIHAQDLIGNAFQ